ncbi:hypothetical protein AURDEDRAFT_168122 [Auricularia subglabra TFB-10046 SS5]|nr:hypothetical protein AURDEDRAFT_168122 [Auricularia subglabra TFB-10046 SS5]
MDPAEHLPWELLGECLRLLSVNERIVASHVSRLWRAISVADPALWSSLVLTKQPVDALETFLSRSHPVPFALIWRPPPVGQGFDTVSPAVLNTIMRNITHFCTLELPSLTATFIDRISQHETPSLACLKCPSRMVSSFKFPETWAERAPRLRVLELGNFVIPQDMAPLPSLRHFSGSIRTFPTSRISRVFPRLEELHLEFLSNTLPISGLETLPRSLTSLTLRAILLRQNAEDVAALYRMAGTLPNLRALSVGVVSGGVPDGIRFFLDRASGPYGLTFESPFDLIMTSDDDGWIHKIQYQQLVGHWQERDGRLASLLGRLSTLTIHLRTLLYFHSRHLTWDCTMPALVELTIKTPRMAPTRLSPTFLTPALQRVTLEIGPHSWGTDADQPATWVSDEAPTVLASMLVTSREPQFKLLAVRMPQYEELLRRDLTLLRGLAGELRIESPSEQRGRE